MMKTLLKVRY